MGYQKLGRYLLIIKEERGPDAGLYLRTGTLSDNSTLNDPAVFSLEAGVRGVGAISRRSIARLWDEPLFLTSDGVYAVTSNLITAERTVKNSSYFVDYRLLREENLPAACAACWQGRYLLGVNGHVYVLEDVYKRQGRRWHGSYPHLLL